MRLTELFLSSRNKGSFGFDKPFPADSKPTPRRLQLKPEHVQYMSQAGNPPLSFTAARFNSGIGEEEKSIVTSTGKFVITWNFRRVKQGRMDDYKISSYNDKVVADNFKLGTNASGIVVALRNDVYVRHRIPSSWLPADWALIYLSSGSW